VTALTAIGIGVLIGAIVGIASGLGRHAGSAATPDALPQPTHDAPRVLRTPTEKTDPPEPALRATPEKVAPSAAPTADEARQVAGVGAARAPVAALPIPSAASDPTVAPGPSPPDERRAPPVRVRQAREPPADLDRPGSSSYPAAPRTTGNAAPILR